MVQKIVDDIRAALNNDLYFVALSAALTLPDIEDWQNRPLDEVYPILYIAYTELLN